MSNAPWRSQLWHGYFVVMAARKISFWPEGYIMATCQNSADADYLAGLVNRDVGEGWFDEDQDQGGD